MSGHKTLGTIKLVLHVFRIAVLVYVACSCHALQCPRSKPSASPWILYSDMLWGRCEFAVFSPSNCIA